MVISTLAPSLRAASRARWNAWRKSAARFELRWPDVLVLGCFVALFIAHLTLLRPVLQNGDSAVYNRQIEARDPSVRTTHIGYIALGIVFDRVLPFATDLNMNVMVLTLGFLGLGALYVLSRALSGSRLAGLCAVASALVLPSELRGLLISEVDVVGASLVVLAYACFVCASPLVAGLSFGLSVLVTPLSGPLLVLFVLTPRIESRKIAHAARRHALELCKFGAAALLVYLPPVLTHYQDYVDGPRGLLHAPRANWAWPERVAHSSSFIQHEAGFFVPLYALGAAVCLASGKLWRAGQPALALLASVGLMAVVAQRFLDVPVQLPNLLLASLLPGLALALTLAGRVWPLGIGSLLLIAACLLEAKQEYPRVQAEIAEQDRTRKLCSSIAEQSRPFTPVLVGITGWTPKRIYERYASDRAHPAIALDWREFVGREARFLAPRPRYELWMFRRPSESSLRRLRAGYALESRVVGSRKFQVLVPLAK